MSVRHAAQWLRSLLFIISMYASMLVLAVAFAPMALFGRSWAYRACHTYCAWVIWTASWMVGLKAEVRGTPPTGEVLVASKHQSFFDIIVLFHALPRARFIMKHILLFAPLFGQYAWRIGCVPVNRGRRGAAIRKMIEDVERGKRDPGQLIIYPQGTRLAPGAKRPYKAGTAALYTQLGQTCVPVATNVGVFWPRRGILRRPGTAVVEFLEPIPPGHPPESFMADLEDTIETASEKLLAEATASTRPG